MSHRPYDAGTPVEVIHAPKGTRDMEGALGFATDLSEVLRAGQVVRDGLTGQAQRIPDHYDGWVLQRFYIYGRGYMTLATHWVKPINTGREPSNEGRPLMRRVPA